jgi:hypothetical protein
VPQSELICIKAHPTIQLHEGVDATARREALIFAAVVAVGVFVVTYYFS